MADDFKRWDHELQIAERGLVPGEIIKLRSKLVFMTLGAAVELSPGRFVRLSGVILMTPVDTGRARASWNVSAGSPSTRVPPPGRYRRPAAIGPARQALSGIGLYDSIWITSTLPYIKVLEYGGYPDPPKLGSWDKRRGVYVIKSSKGFSKQAPRGMVRVTYAQVLNALGFRG
jgi:hypothetical protein